MIDTEYKEFLDEHLPLLKRKRLPFWHRTRRSKHDALRYCLKKFKVSPSDLVAEFGVWRGTTLRMIANRYPNNMVFGFDSFTGFPDDGREDWQKNFSLNGELTHAVGRVRPCRQRRCAHRRARPPTPRARPSSLRARPSTLRVHPSTPPGPLHLDVLLQQHHDADLAKLFFSLWAFAVGRPAIARMLRRFYAGFVARVVAYVRDTDQGRAADLEQRAWLFVALLEGASVLRVIAGQASHDEALRGALRRILAG